MEKSNQFLWCVFVMLTVQGSEAYNLKQTIYKKCVCFEKYNVFFSDIN